MQARVLSALLLAVTCLACSEDDGLPAGVCPSGTVCGFEDHKYFSTYVCGGMSVGYSWRDQGHCVQQCAAAAGWSCDTSTCNCSVDHGSGSWLPCNEANGGEESSGGCFLSGSGMNGETVACVCR
jgi:hypothetical protein